MRRPLPTTQKLNDLLQRTGDQTSAFLDQFSDVKCTEHVRQEKLGKDDKVELKEESTYDYLVILTNTGGELNLSESRLPMHEAKTRPQEHVHAAEQRLRHAVSGVPSATMPRPSSSALAGRKSIAGRMLEKISFQHVPGMKSPAALALRGREYPLELSGTAWIDPESRLHRQDRSRHPGHSAGCRPEVSAFGNRVCSPAVRRLRRPVYWFPTQATVEVETPRQHWRNLHRFTEYKKFSVSTEEKVTSK